MKTHTLVSIALLGLLLGASCIQANDTDDTDDDPETERKEAVSMDNASEESEEDTEDAPKKEKTTEIEEEKDVMVLHSVNFDRALSENQYLLVEFYAPWCGHCKQLEPVYAEAAGKLKEEGSAIRLAKVNAIEDKEMSEEFNVEGFPSLKLFVNGDRKEPIDYTGKRTAKGMVQWLKRRTGSGPAVLDTVESAADIIDDHNILVVGFFENLESEAAKEFLEVAMDMTDAEFAVTASPEVFQKYEVKSDTVVLFKKFDDGRDDFAVTGELDKSDLVNFIKQNSLELVIPFSEEVADQVFTSKIMLHCLLFINSTVESQTALVDEVRAVAKEFKGKMLFIKIDVTGKMDHVLEYFGVSKDEVPTLRIINMQTTKKFRITSGDLSANSLRQLCQEVVDGTAKPYLRSEEIPEDWNKGPVKVLVGKNFESVALDETKNVFVEFYAPWCGHCKELTPIWEQLGEKYADHDDIIIAKMDSTANEVDSLDIRGFPTLKYFPAGGKEVVDYTAKRDLETMSKFLDDGGVLPEQESDEQEDEDEDDDEDNEEEGDEDDEDAGDDDDSQEVDDSAEVPNNTSSKDEL
ncbi:protein disulfide-isomerase A2 [Scomber japonicus]|uniref:protein disulfide-isomerase A2 n=1 Tax=Scomber japonicus TaxID=13676 RepID=UPI002306556B|nr:protein disulfide-isomerase A2 [Scomber japonicus]